MGTEALAIANLDSLRARESDLLLAVSRINGPRIPFPLDKLTPNRSLLRIGDVLFIDNEGADVQMGLLVVKGKGFKAECAPLFCLVRGEPLCLTEEGPDLHNPKKLIIPHISYKHAGLRPTDEQGNQILFPATSAAIVRPANKRLQAKIEQFYSYDFLSRHLARWSIPLIVTFGGREILIAATRLVSGVVMKNKDIMDDTVLLGIGSVAYWAAGRCYDAARKTYEDASTIYANYFPTPNGNFIARKVIKDAFSGGGGSR